MMITIPQKFKETVDKFSNRPAVKFKYHGAYISVTFSQLYRRVQAMAKGLQSLGLKHGDRFAILSENRSEWVRADLAALTLGAITVPVHTTLSPRIISHILNDAKIKILFVSNQENFNKLLLIEKELPALQQIIYINLDNKPENFSKTLISLDEVMKLGESDGQEINTEISPDDVASIVYTSGTTALPKGVMLTHHNFLFDAEASVTAVPVNEHDVLLSFLPLSHVLERTAGYYAPLLCRCCCIAYAESIKTLTTNLREVRPTILISVPRIFEKMHDQIWEKVKRGGKLKYKIFVWALKQAPGTASYFFADLLVFKKIRATLGGRFRLTICGGASLNHKLAKFFYRIGIKIVEGYGLTETAPVITVNRPDNFKFGTVGLQLPGVEIKIAPDKEILIHGPNVMKGYYNNKKMTDEAIDADGWFHTGDLGFMSSDGFLVIIGRKKEMISMSNGKIVWPEQIELVLNDDRFIIQSMIHGHNRNYLSALIVPDWQEVLRTLDELGVATREPDELLREPKLIKLFEHRLEKINHDLADWEKIRKFILLRREFSQEKDELTPTLKVRRHIIEKHYLKQIEKMYQ